MATDESRSSSLQSVLSGAGFFLSGKLVSNLFGFVSNFLLTHGLGPGLFGMYALAKTISKMLGSVSNLGSDKAVLRYVSSQEFDQETYLGLSYIVAIVGSLVAAALLFVFAPIISSWTFGDQQFVLVLRAFAFVTVCMELITITGNGFRALDRPELDSLLQQVVRQGSLVVFIGAAFVLSYEIEGYLAATVFGTAVAATIGIGLLLRSTTLQPRFSIHDISLRSYLRYSLPLSVKDAGSVLYTRADILLLGAFVSSSKVGYYRIAVLLTALLALPLNAISRIFPPVIARLYTEERFVTMASVYKTAARWVLTGTLPMIAGLLVYRTEILSLFGSSFTYAAAILVVLAAGQLFNAIVGPTGFLLMMTDRQFVVTVNQWVFGGTNVILNVILIQRYGAIGAAIATASTLAVLNVVRVVEVAYLEQIHPFSISMTKPVLATSVCLVIMVFIRMISAPIPGLLFGGFLGVFAYLGVIALLGLEEDDRMMIQQWRN